MQAERQTALVIPPGGRVPRPVTIGRENLHEIFSAPSFALPVLKEPNYSSTFFVNQLRRRLSRRGGISTHGGMKRFRIGHAGTLDPFAEGVLVVLGGYATEEQAAYMAMPKTYEAEIALGVETDTLDCDGAVTRRDDAFRLDPEVLEPVLQQFRGEISQVPPAFSAVYVEGRRAYKLARKGLSPDLAPRRAQVYSLEIARSSEQSLTIRLVCGSGTYVRALARDIAVKLGTVGHLSSLVRHDCGGFSLAQCLKLREVLDSQPVTKREVVSEEDSP